MATLGLHLVPCKATGTNGDSWAKLDTWEQSHLEYFIAQQQLLLAKTKVATIAPHQTIYRAQVQAEIQNWRDLMNSKRRMFLKAEASLADSNVNDATRRAFLLSRGERRALSGIHAKHYETLAKRVHLQPKSNQQDLLSLDEALLDQRQLASVSEGANDEAVNILLVMDKRNFLTPNSLEKKVYEFLRSHYSKGKGKMLTLELNSHHYDSENGHLVRNLLLEWEDQSTPTFIFSVGKAQETVVDFFDNFPSYSQSGRIYGWIDYRDELVQPHPRVFRTIASSDSENPVIQKRLNSAINRLENDRTVTLPIITNFPVYFIRAQGKHIKPGNKESMLRNSQYLWGNYRDTDSTIQKSINLLRSAKLSKEK